MALIKTTTEFKKYVAIDANTRIETLTPFIDEAEQLYIRDLLGAAFYAVLTTAYDATPGTPMPAELAALLPYVQRPLAYYAQLRALPQLAVTFGDMGIRQHRAEESDSAPRWLMEKLQFHALQSADISADAMLAFLEEKATASVYQEWYGSEANTRNSGYLVYGTSVASKHIDINQSRRVFLKLRQKIREIETRFVPKLIGPAQYADLIIQIKADTVSPAYRALIDRIEPIICKYALYLQLQFMRVQINEHGIFVYSGQDDIFKLGQLASDADVKILRQQLMDGEFGYIADEEELRQFILDNIADYPLIQSSPVYTVQPDPGPTFKYDNDSNNKHFVA